MIEFYVDGSCRKNPGPGGFGVVCINCDKIIYKYSEYCNETTNNREEMKAILHVFELIIKEDLKDVIIYSDSAYCVNMINDWIWKWSSNNWQNSKKVTVENLDLVLELYKNLITDFFPCQVKKTNGHCGIAANELADALATNNKIKYVKILKEHGLEEAPIDIFKN